MHLKKVNQGPAVHPPIIQKSSRPLILDGKCRF